MDLKKLVNKGVDSLSPYEPGKPIEDLEREIGIKNAIKLASNENPLGPSPKVLQSIDAILKETHRYPDGNATRLKDSIAKKFNTSPNQVTIGNGSNDIIEFIARSFLGPNDSAIYSEHAFAVYPLVVKADTSSGLLSLNSIIDTTSIDVVVGGIGRITKYDIDVASLYETIIVSYNIPISKEIHDYAMSKDVYIEQGDVLPELLERIFQHFDIDISDDTKKVMGEEEEDV